jgi:sodium/bile acid cotransporter 7
LIRKNWFFLGILLALAAGFLSPGAATLLNPAGISRRALIAGLFLISGLTLPSESLLGGLKELRLHLYVQGFIFLLTPAFFWLTTLSFTTRWPEEVLLGIYALAVLPTTVSSCIVFTQISGGNVAGTMVNAAAANVIGVLVSPLLLSLLSRVSGATLPAAEIWRVLRELGLLMLAPIAAGQLARRRLHEWAGRRRGTLVTVASAFVLAILFFSFAQAAGSPDFFARLRSLLLPFAYLAAAQLVLTGLAYGGARLLRLSRESTISVLFTAPQKTMAMGVPLISTYFAGTPTAIGLIVLPLVFYHSWQLLVAGVVKNWAAGILERRESGAT